MAAAEEENLSGERLGSSANVKLSQGRTILLAALVGAGKDVPLSIFFSKLDAW